ncbi:nucleolin-like [Nycticebus coucang]|uniref:nucleolin-like n=1 Tax=Nycticebus coucang TaxID=9470 RepID=UPI00234DB010|nr:nucleolin-like [Nycticebus coucang]
MSLSPKETEVGENVMSEDKDNGSGDEVVILQNNGRKHAMAPGRKKGGKKSVAPMFAEKLSRKGSMWAKRAQDRRSAKLENHENFEESEDENSELDELEEEPIKKTPNKRKKEMAKQKASPGTKKRKFKAEAPGTFKLHVGNLNCNKTATELKTGLSEFFAKNDLAVVGVRVGLSRRFGYVNFKSADDQEKALELSNTKVLGCEIKLKKPKGKETKKDHNTRTLLIKNLPDKVNRHKLKEVFEDAFQIRLVRNKNGMSKSGKTKDRTRQPHFPRRMGESLFLCGGKQCPYMFNMQTESLCVERT